MYIFSMDNPFFRFVGKMVDLLWINILTLICCIPVFTIGAAISAMYKILLQIQFGEEGTLTKGYFKAFKEGFKNATIVWVPSFIIFTIMFSNIYLIYQGVLAELPKLQTTAGICIGIVCCVLLMFLQYFWALNARFDTDLKQTAKNAVLLEFAFFPRSICILVMLFFPVALMLLSDYFLLFWFFYGFTVPGFMAAMLLKSIMIKTKELTENSEKEE